MPQIGGPLVPRAGRVPAAEPHATASAASALGQPRAAAGADRPLADFAAALRAATKTLGGSRIVEGTVYGSAEGFGPARSLMLSARRQGATSSAPSSMRAIPQTDPSEYDSPEQARTWGGSTCSAASLTAVLRARGVPVRIADVMRAMPGGLTPELGLVSRRSLMEAAEQFGAGARDDVASHESLRAALAAGQPVLVDVRNQRFPEGHWMVATSVNEQGVGVIDSSGYRLTSIPREEFLESWSGRGIRILPSAPGRPAQTGRRS